MTDRPTQKPTVFGTKGLDKKPEYIPSSGIYPLKNVEVSIYFNNGMTRITLDHMNIQFFKNAIYLTSNRGPNNKVIIKGEL